MNTATFRKQIKVTTHSRPHRVELKPSGLPPMPCQYTEEELDEEIRCAEEEGFLTEAETRKAFSTWGIEL